MIEAAIAGVGTTVAVEGCTVGRSVGEGAGEGEGDATLGEGPGLPAGDFGVAPESIDAVTGNRLGPG